MEDAMSSIWIVLLPIVGVVMGLLIARLLWKKSVIFDVTPFNVSLADAEKRINDELGRIKETFDKALRDVSTQSNTVHNELATRLTESIDKYRNSLETTLGNRLESFEKSQGDALNKARGSQDERLDKLQQTISALQTAVQKAHSDLKSDVLRHLGDEAGRSARDISALRESLTRGFSDFREQVVSAQNKAAKETTDTLKSMSTEQHDHSEKQVKSLNEF